MKSTPASIGASQYRALVLHLDQLLDSLPPGPDLQRLRIRGEYISGVVETTALDNVAITAVPEPASWALMLSGVALVAAAARRRFG